MRKYFGLILFLLPLITFAQLQVTGIVTDESNFPLPGASIIVKGTTKGEITNIDGKFTITLDETPATLVISYLGFKSKEVIINSQTNIKVVLEEDKQTLDEVVIIGYGEVNKKDLTGAISSVNKKEDLVSQSNNVEELLQGRAAGVLVQSSFEPGAANSIRIRGLNSLTGNTQPLYVIDGIIVDSATEDTLDPLSSGNSYLSPQGGITGLNPRDIENIEVLKDASATAIYGSRGANGVIIITTKKGVPGEAKFTFNTSTRIGHITNNIDVLNTGQYVQYQNDIRANQGFNPRYYTYPDGSIALFEVDEQFMIDNANTIERIEGVDWTDDTYRTAITNKYRLAVSGGGDNGNYYISAGYLQNEGIVPRAIAKSTDFNAKLTNNLTDKLELTTKIAAQFTQNFASKGTENLGGTSNSLIRQVVSGAPIIGQEDNFEGDEFDISLDGPRAWISDYDDESKETRLLGSLKLDYKISNAFTYRVAIGTDYRVKERQVWYGTALRRGALSNGEAGLSNLERFRYNIDNTLMFKHRFNRNHRINGTVGFIVDQRQTKFTTASATNFPLQDLRADGITTGQNQQPTFYYTEEESLLSYLGRLNYTMFNKYLFTATFRADGSSKFRGDNRWGYFPAFAFAWKMKEENFLKDSKFISQAKLRIGWGLTGNQAIDPYSTITRFNLTETPYSDAEGNPVTSLVPQNLSNPKLKWETTSQYNAGLDFGMANDRVTGSVDVYYKNIYDLLLNAPIAPSNGFETTFFNRGELINKGIEISINADIVSNDNFKWNVYGNIAFNRNEVGDIGFSPNQFGTETYSAYLGSQISGGNFFKTEANIFIEGEEPGLFYGYATNGIVSNQDDVDNAASFNGTPAQLGDVYLVDQNGDGIINNNDLTIIGNPNPDFNYGFGTSFEYKNWSLSALFNGVYGNDIANGNLLREAYADNGSTNVRSEAYFNAWTPDNPNGTYPRVGYDLADETGFTDRIVEDGSFLRLSNVTLGYRIPFNDTSVLDNAYISISGQNLLLFTNYSGFDPEGASFTFDPGRVGVDWNSFPNQRTFTLALNLTF
ncbi:TonB-dependent receptor [Psychroserpens sp. SPM9]|uniref:SusC/RagA family TonB-linked outer membrane protein n=1 Tax=Psychroserpens sp. SPM9 TaxID=2975598 RepID=UPI0021A41FF6|nr:TonB-dependent receptor [Psychroserpens sp. SPM9]MDG5490083.1 TonB-dependent receptor [Psychroserpens sp. SPM9]